MTAYTYYRLNITSLLYASVGAEIAEFKIQPYIGGDNLVTTIGGTATAKDVWSGRVASNAFDSNNTTYWNGSTHNSGWLKFQFNSAVTASYFTIVASAAQPTLASPKTFTIDASNDNTNWTTLYTSTTQGAWTANESRSFSSQAKTISGNILETSAIVDWCAIVTDLTTQSQLGNQTISGSSYSVTVASDDAVMVTLSPKIDGIWRASRSIPLDFYVVSTTPDTTPHLWKCTTAGITGSTEPTWNLSGTTTDGTVTWTYIAPLVDPVTIGPKIPA